MTVVHDSEGHGYRSKVRTNVVRNGFDTVNVKELIEKRKERHSSCAKHIGYVGRTRSFVRSSSNRAITCAVKSIMIIGVVESLVMFR